MELRSQEVRTLAPENDPLKMGMGWKVEAFAKSHHEKLKLIKSQ